MKENDLSWYISVITQTDSGVQNSNIYLDVFLVSPYYNYL